MGEIVTGISVEDGPSGVYIQVKRSAERLQHGFGVFRLGRAYHRLGASAFHVFKNW